MKKLMVALASIALGAYAWGDIAIGTSGFEAGEAGVVCVGEPLTLTAGPDEQQVWFNTGDENPTLVTAYEDAQPVEFGSNFLGLDTGSTPLYRTFADCTGAASIDGATAVNFGEAFFSTRVQLSASEEAPAGENGQISLWLKENEDETTGDISYQLMVRAAQIDITNNGAILATNDYPVIAGTIDINPTNWYTVTVAPVLSGGSIVKTLGCFIIKIDDAFVTLAPDAANPFDGEGSIDDYLNADNQRYAALGQIFPSLLPLDDANSGKISAVGFAGTGKIDNLDIADVSPIPVPVTVKVASGVTITKVMVGDVEVPVNVDGTYSIMPGETATITFSKGGKTVTAPYDVSGAEIDAEDIVFPYDVTVADPVENCTVAVTQIVASVATELSTTGGVFEVANEATVTVTYTPAAGYKIVADDADKVYWEFTSSSTAFVTTAPKVEAEAPESPFKGEGTAASPFQIWTVADLQKLNELVTGGENYTGKYFKQMADIDFTGVEGWQGIGAKGQHQAATGVFEGNYDGNGKKIENVTITSTANYTAALFNTMRDGTIKDLTVQATITGTSGSCFVGVQQNVTFERCTAQGTIMGTHHCGAFMTFGVWGGGAYETAVPPTFIDCTNEANVASSKSAAGFCGKPQTGATFIRCVNKGTIGADGKMGGDGGLGGFCSGGTYGDYTDCVNEGVVLGTFGQFGSSLPTSVAGTMVARADQLAATGAFDGVNFADKADIVDNMATLISNDQVVVGGEYKVMTKIATIPVTFDTVGQTIAFDVALNEAFAADITATGVGVETNLVEKLLTYTAIEAPAPSEDWPDVPADVEGTDAKTAFPNLPADFEGADAGLVAAWAKGKGNLAYADMATASIDAFLLDCAESEVETEAAKFKIISIENINGEWVVKVTGEKAEGQNYTVNAKVDIVPYEITGAAEDAAFFKAQLVPYIVETKE